MKICHKIENLDVNGLCWRSLACVSIFARVALDYVRPVVSGVRYSEIRVHLYLRSARRERESNIADFSGSREMTQTPRRRRIGEQAGELECLLHILEATYGQTDGLLG